MNEIDQINEELRHYKLFKIQRLSTKNQKFNEFNSPANAYILLSCSYSAKRSKLIAEVCITIATLPLLVTTKSSRISRTSNASCVEAIALALVF